VTSSLLRRLIQLDADDYRDGDAFLLIRVTQEPKTTDDPEWFEVTGLEINGFGERVGERTIHMPARVLRKLLMRAMP
jgi:hypothetical protein